MAFEITGNQKVKLSAKFVGADGLPLEVENIEWSTNNPAVVELTPAPDDACIATPVGPIGVAGITVRGTLPREPLPEGEELPEGQEPQPPEEILGHDEVAVVKGDATIVELEASEPISRDEEFPEPAAQEAGRRSR